MLRTGSPSGATVSRALAGVEKGFDGVGGCADGALAMPERNQPRNALALHALEKRLCTRSHAGHDTTGVIAHCDKGVQ